MNLKDFAFWFMIAGIFILGIYLVIYIKNESYQCMNNPYTYSMELLEKANSAEVSCICTAYKGAASTSVLLTKEGFKEIIKDEEYNEEKNLSFDFSKIITID